MTVTLPSAFARSKMAAMMTAFFQTAKSDDVIVSEVRFDETPINCKVDMKTIRAYRRVQCTCRGQIRNLETGVIKSGERWTELIRQESLQMSTKDEAIHSANSTAILDADKLIRYLEAA